MVYIFGRILEGKASFNHKGEDILSASVDFGTLLDQTRKHYLKITSSIKSLKT